MKLFRHLGLVIAAAGLVVARPLSLLSQGVGNTASDLENGICKPFTLIFARGTTEAGNLGGTVGPAFCNTLRTLLGKDKVACQGVGDPYKAAIPDNFSPKGTSVAAIGEATRLFNLAQTKCPTTKVIAGGYSQGGAVMHGAISALAENLKNQIGAAVMFGDARNLQDKGQIPNFPKSKTMIICAPLDAVCLGTDFITPQHLSYIGNIGAAVAFVTKLLL